MTLAVARAFNGGKLVPPLTGATFDAVSPATGRPIAAVAECGPEDVDLAVEAARSALEQGRWSDAAPSDRKEVLLAFASLVESDAKEIARLDADDAFAKTSWISLD